jgi:hypothetical protein
VLFPVVASRTIGQVKLTVALLESMTAFAADSSSEQDVPVPSAWLTSQARTIWVALPPVWRYELVPPTPMLASHHD